MPCGAELWRDSRYIHPCGLGPVGSEGERTNGVVTKEESAEHLTHAAIRTYCPEMEEFGVPSLCCSTRPKIIEKGGLKPGGASPGCARRRPYCWYALLHMINKIERS
eukprot:scaffold6852_cov173-Skeletonema_dohrnii-CCMP3373.AAC.2